MKQVIFFLLLSIQFSCEAQTTEVKDPPFVTADAEGNYYVEGDVPKDSLNLSDRTEIKGRLKAKFDKGENIVIHILVPLCDNDYQGIVPVNSRLGDGMNLKTNLYWGAGYGIKSHFYYHTKWKLTRSSLNVNEHILERVVFKKQKGNSTVFIVADAYRGDRMVKCLGDYVESLAGANSDTLIVGSDTININGDADLICFNGHNGLMDETTQLVFNQDGREKDAVVIACASHGYFTPYLKAAGGYPLVLTTNLLAPEAYVMEAVVESWLNLKSGEECRLAAGDGYNSIQKCGQNGARRLFKSGW